jgi:hypothetical protein
LVVAALAVSIAVVAVGVVLLTNGSQASRPATPRADVYTQLAQQLKRHLQPLVTVVTRKAPNIQIPQQNGYSCAIATTSGCSLHPCVRYAYAQTAVPYDNGAPVVSATGTSSCRKAANAVPRAIPINAP